MSELLVALTLAIAVVAVVFALIGLVYGALIVGFFVCLALIPIGIIIGGAHLFLDAGWRAFKRWKFLSHKQR